jgi:hypothetical protein
MFIRRVIIAFGAASLVAGGAGALAAGAPVTTAAVRTPAAAHAVVVGWVNGTVHWPGGGWLFRGRE